MSRNSDFPDKVSVPIQADEDGFTGRECPNEDCEGYFKIEFGTGHCPYCGHTANHDHFWTKEQLEYAKSVAMRQFTKAVHRELKRMEFNIPARGPFGIGVSMKVKEGPLLPLRYYREKQLETEVVCSKCTLHYSIFGVFAYCPDCGVHNSRQILSKNLELAIRELNLAQQVDTEDLKAHLIDDSLENVVSAFDGFGRELVRVHANKVSEPEKARSLSFQNLAGVRTALQTLFGFDLAAAVEPSEWDAAIRSFNKRHLLAHKMGVVDQRYLDATGDNTTTVGRRIAITADEVRLLVDVAMKLGDHLVREVSDGKT